MLSYCLKCKNNTESKNPKVVRTKNGIINLLTKYALCDDKKLKCITEQEANGLLSGLGIKIALNKVPLLGPIQQVNTRISYKWMK